MPIKLKWAYEEGGVRHEPGDTVTLSSAEEKRLVVGRYAVRVEEAQEVFEEETPPADPEDEEPKADPEPAASVEDLASDDSEPAAPKKKGAGRKGAAEDES